MLFGKAKEQVRIRVEGVGFKDQGLGFKAWNSAVPWCTMSAEECL